jgi:hypothetical protein
MLPADWEQLRMRWELGHALSAALTLALLAADMRSEPVLPRRGTCALAAPG